ncbi:hypothetical protein [Streptomyces sp. NPDC127039]|uniref:hypothetical protein n=1 Tax=Streptomyces sp. NPDC127039 TaxID=3347115 RepID=UPI003653A7C4
MGHASRAAAHALLDNLDDGYALRFTRSGLIFDLAREGTNSELDDEVEFHRIGSDLITELINAIPTLIEMVSLPAPPVNELPRPLATVVFRYSRTMYYAPEFTSMARPNDDQAQLQVLKERYGAEPQALSDVLLLAPTDQVADRRREFPGIDVQPLAFSSAELQASHWRFLMGAVGNQSMYIRQLTRIMKANRNNLNLGIIMPGSPASSDPAD